VSSPSRPHPFPVLANGEAALTAAVGIPNDVLGQSIVACATAKPGRTLDSEAILAHCRKVLLAYMVPREIVFRTDMPLNSNGKIDRKALATDVRPHVRPAERPDRNHTSFWRAGGPNRHSARLQATALCVGRRNLPRRLPDRPVNASDSFAPLGGDSLSNVTVAIELREHI
jgi:hypothetical protein